MWVEMALRRGPAGPLSLRRRGMDSSVQKVRAFEAAARLGSMSRAAEELGVAQSTLSRSVASLEQSWGVRLFDRHGPMLSLTRDGERLLPDARALCEASAALCRRVLRMSALEDGCVSMAAPSSVVAMRLPGPLGRFSADHPGVEVNINECTYGEAERLLLGGAVELAFIPNRLEDQGFISSVYDKDEIVVVAPPGHFAPEPASIPVETLLGERFIADTETAPLLQRELKAPRINCETSNITAILAMVEAGLGVSLLPSLALERTGFSLDVRHLATPAHRELYLVRRRTADLSLAAQAFLGYL